MLWVEMAPPFHPSAPLLLLMVLPGVTVVTFTRLVQLTAWHPDGIAVGVGVLVGVFVGVLVAVGVGVLVGVLVGVGGATSL